VSRGVEAPLALTAIAVAVGNGWIESMWNWMYTATHTGASLNPFVNPPGGPATPVTVGKGGDAVTGGAPGQPQVTITGTMSGGSGTGAKFIPNDPKIPTFTVGPNGANIPANVLTIVYKLFGSKPSSGGSNGVTIW
jgi:hypothetical protein